ncbi:EAL domain-containing protein [Falsiroseomonas tokyonensis]|uniref:EAL domain-containing protein n=1 Tax=Falsiroseomonas tokyonensis TaxID=430521 RepID=A0ABV7BTQ9_9PROT|nr:EAL domain-containing protein [Falsiroseomonas tokyonensis]MBU8538033.1 EAL domain-containing protein [Falsiroseomonas tokyonensis]
MLRRPRRADPEPGIVLLVASDPLVIAATRDAARRMAGPPPVLVTTAEEALSQMVGPGNAPRHLVVESGAGSSALLSAARDPFNGTGVVVVARPGQTAPAGLPEVPPEAAQLAAALARGQARRSHPSDAAALAEGLAKGEITVRFQPMVRLADRRLVMVEALARWERPGAALGANAFVPLAERAGLAGLLTLAVARRAMQELAAHRAGRHIRLSFNVPLPELLRPDLPVRLLRLAAEAGLAPAEMLLELTESTEVRDRALLRRALLRLGRAGFGVLLDDLALDDGRRDLLDLPFAGVKLDRKLVLAMPHERRARAEVERVVRHARRRGMVVIAEGVTDSHVWRAIAAAGCDLAQGFGVGRPLPPAALPAWIAAWTAAAMPDRQGQAA